MIVVIGAPAWRATDPVGPAGRACEIAMAAAGAGARVEIVGRVGDDPPGDELLLALARATVGHAAVLRDPARPTPVIRSAPAELEDDPFADEQDAPEARSIKATPDGTRLDAADAALGLRYLTGFDVLVVADGTPNEVLPVCVAAADFAGSHLVVLVAAGSPVPTLPDRAIALSAPDDEGAFGALVGRMSAALDGGLAPDAALRAAAGQGGWEAVADGDL